MVRAEHVILVDHSLLLSVITPFIGARTEAR